MKTPLDKCKKKSIEKKYLKPYKELYKRRKKMEEINLYAIYDRKGDRYDTPFFTSTDLFAQRIFHLRMMEEKSFLKMWPEDFILFQIGHFNVITGTFTQAKKIIVEGQQIQKQEEK